jgi:hypothetical protein
MKRILIPSWPCGPRFSLSPLQHHTAAQGRGGAQITLPDGAGKGPGANDVQQVPRARLIVNGFGYSRAIGERVVGSIGRDSATRIATTVLAYLATPLS